MFGSITATGAGLHVTAYFLEDMTKIGPTATVLTVAVPVAIFILALYTIGSIFLHQKDPFHLVLLGGTAAVIILAIAGAALGLSVPWSLFILAFAPGVTVIGYETVGHGYLRSVRDRSGGLEGALVKQSHDVTDKVQQRQHDHGCDAGHPENLHAHIRAVFIVTLRSARRGFGRRGLAWRHSASRLQASDLVLIWVWIAS
jgi:hypothetical protein